MELLSDALVPPPPPPKGGFGDVLAAAFGAAPDRVGAYQKGLEANTQYKLRTAQTESALAEAEKRRAESLRQSQINDFVTRAQSDPNFNPTLADLLTFSTNASDFTQARLRDQEFGNRSILGDLNAAPEAQFAAGQGVQGKVLPRIQEVGGQNYNLATDPNMQQPTMTPLQEADVAAAKALEGQRNRSPVAGGAGAAGGWNTVTVGGRRLRERTNPETGEYEYEFVTDPQMQGRERMFAERVRVAGESVADTLENISRMPFGASTGIFGVGSSPGKSALTATKDALRNKATDESVQMYTAALAGANRALAVLESAGLAPSGMSQQSFEALSWRAGDDEGTRLYKLAEMRQTVDNALATALTNPAITPEMKGQIEQIQRRVQAAIPYSPMDVLTLRTDPTVRTLEDVMRKRGLNTSAAPAAAAPQAGGEPVRVTTVEEARALPPGTVFITPDGRRKVR
jgi:hypothetical protein